MKHPHTLLLSLTLLTSVMVPAGWAAPLTTDAGAPVGDNQNSQTAGENGPTLLQDFHLIEKLSRFDRERIPERVVHARGTGAHGVFESYDSFAPYTKAAFLNRKGKQTPVFVRFSTVIHPSGSPETARDPRGFATKFYTEEGNYDLVGNNLPVFFIRDAMKFPDMVHSLKPSPVTNKQDPNRFFDFFSHQPESTNMLTFVYSDLGIPASYREMDGFGVHAFKWINAQGQVRYVKYTWTSLQGVKGLTGPQAAEVQSRDWGHLTTDLYDHIKAGQFPSWELGVQMLNPADLNKFAFNPLDATKEWPESVAPLMKVGKMTLNRVPANFFAFSEQAAFSPGVLVPGIEPSEDKLLQGRLFSYADTQRYRLGANYQQLEVNRAVSQVNNYNQDGVMGGQRLPQDDINYQPNSHAQSHTDTAAYRLSAVPTGPHAVQMRITKTDNFTQAGVRYRAFSEAEKQSLINNLTGDLRQVTTPRIQKQMVAHFYKADKDYGQRLIRALALNEAEIAALSAKL